MVVEIKKKLLIFRLALAILWVTAAARRYIVTYGGGGSGGSGDGVVAGKVS